jgi:hypothetical protein
MTVFSDITLRILNEAGWFSGRSVSTDAFEAFIAREGFYLNDTIRTFLREFGGITLKIPYSILTSKGKPITGERKIPIGMLVPDILGQIERIPLFESILGGEMLVPVGFDHSAVILMSYSGNTYFAFDGYFNMLPSTPHEMISYNCEFKLRITKEQSTKKTEILSSDYYTLAVTSSEPPSNFANHYPKKLIPISETSDDNNRRTLYGLHLYTNLKNIDTPQKTVLRMQDFLNDFVGLHSYWAPFRILSSIRCRSTVYNCSPPLEVLKYVMCEEYTKIYQCHFSKILLGNLSPDMDFSKLVDILFNLEEQHTIYNIRYSRVTFPPIISSETKQFFNKQLILSTFELYFRHWQSSYGRIGPSNVLISKYSVEDFNENAYLNMTIPIGWLTYFSNEFGVLPELPDWVQIVPVEGYGIYIQVSDELPDTQNEDQLRMIVERICRLSKILRPWLETKKDLMN